MDDLREHLFTTGFASLVGIEVTEFTDDVMRARIAVRDELKQPAGIVDGGVYATIAEDMASAGTFLQVRREGKVAMGMANQSSFLRPVSGGHIHVVARPRHRGRTTWVWEVEFFDDDERLCALTRMTIAVRDAPAG